MKSGLVPALVSAVVVAVFVWPLAADAKSAKQVFAEVARSVVVVLAADSGGEVASRGSGVVVGDNEVATNCHVLDDAANVSVRQAADAGGGESYRIAIRWGSSGTSQNVFVRRGNARRGRGKSGVKGKTPEELNPCADWLRDQPRIDWLGNNAAFICPGCDHVFIVTRAGDVMLDKRQDKQGERVCPVCKKYKAYITGGRSWAAQGRKNKAGEVIRAHIERLQKEEAK